MSSQGSSSDQFKLLQRGRLVRFIVTIVIATAGILTTYHTTIYGLREELNRKADRELVAAIDSHLVRIETILNERMATKAELQQTREALTEKLNSIELQLRSLP